MVDNIKIIVSGERLNIDRLLSYDSTVCQRSAYNRYRLYERDKTYLELWNSKGGVIIQGSWRKWHYGKYSLKDLTRIDLFQVCVELSQKLGISIKTLLEAKVLMVEFGLTFSLPIPPSAILHNMYRYSTLELVQAATSVSFRGNDYWLKVYDKGIQINKICSKRGQPEIVKGMKVLRIELRVFRRTAFHSRLRKVETVKDIIANYRNLVISLYHEIKKIDIEPLTVENGNISFEGKKISDFHNYQQYYFMKAFGVGKTFEFLNQLNMANSGKSYQRKKCREILAQYEGKAEFSRDEFLKTIINQLIPQLSVVNPLIA